ncbi:hypothetical protein [Nocardioides panaciterrulae]|uniref:AbiEi antitoxin C-terminal domain-containing protein n=1 Tax=Nocardioides panaciterrulae TaxID=661492 RepID=A0A7Y9JBY0_9ACTN|nr:hypothetical protein [Nocardioides panaciterrulae]NYD43297.1 hypothetical protein [Nocardioides panaciterrulae]
MGIEELLERQSGVIGRLQLRAAGWDELDVARTAERRGWRALHEGVYLACGAAPSWLQRSWAAVLLAWPAALCHRSVLRLADGPGRRDGGDAVIHVAVDRDSRFVAPAGIRAHRLDGLGDRVRWDLSPPRVPVEDALLDVAAELAGRTGDGRTGGGRTGGGRTGGGRTDDAEVAALAWLADAVRCRRTTPERLHDALARLGPGADPGRRELLAGLLAALTDLPTPAAEVRRIEVSGPRSA